MTELKYIGAESLAPRTLAPKSAIYPPHISYIMGANDGTVIAAPVFSNIIPINVNALAPGGTSILVPYLPTYLNIIGKMHITASLTGAFYIQDSSANVKMIITLTGGVDQDIDFGLFGTGNCFSGNDFIIKNPTAGVISFAGFITYAQVLP